MLETIIAVAGLYIAYITYKKSFPAVAPEPTEEKANLLANYKMTQRLSLDVQSEIQKHINLGNGDKLMYPNCTFSQFLKLAEDEFDKSLSDELYIKLKELPMTKSNIDSMLSMIDTQNKALLELKNQMLILNL